MYYIEYWKQADLPVYMFNIRISGKMALYVNVSYKGRLK